jgi:adenosylcobinamide kinase/adenosylcobinamide-phosphate guanylyltransferase
MMAERDIAAESRDLVAALPALGGPVVFVSNEVGLGIVPENRMAREFRDHAGFLHQSIAAAADEVYFMAAGLPLKMKG